MHVLASVIAGMMIVRLFIVYHDYQHGTILKGSPLAADLMTAYGLVTVNPPSIWNRSHNYHHKHNAKMYGTAIGSYPLMTVASYWPPRRGSGSCTASPATRSRLLWVT